ncbi:MAG: hypothetical protein ABI670_07205 [Chloroflexota bacterium]
MRLPERLFWWLVPLVGLVVVLFTSYQAITSRRYEYANGITGELLPGHSVGQTLVSRYANLSGIEVLIGTYRLGDGPARASLVLHLKEADSGSDIATVTLPAGTNLAQNPWYLFSFPTVANSQDHAFYVEIESPDGAPDRALTLFSWTPNPQGDPYPDGTAYLDGKPEPGDLSFGLRYAPSPLDAAAQMGRSMTANLPAWMILLLFACAAVCIAALFFLLAILRDPERRQRWLRRWSLPFVLGIALLNGLLYLFLVPPWQGPDEHTHFAYVVLLDRYDLDRDRLESLYFDSKIEDEALVQSVTDSMARYNFTRYLSGHPAPGTPPDVRPTIYQSLGKPPAYYWLGVVALRAARALGIAADPYTNPEGVLLLLRGVSLMLGLIAVALAWLFARIVSAKGSSWLVLLLPLTIALLPMHTFDMTIANNDVMAEVAVSAMVVVLAALLRWPTGWRAIALAALAVLLAFGSLLTKQTAAASLPLLALGLLIWVGLLANRALQRRAEGQVSDRRWWMRVSVPAALLGLVALLALISVVLAYEPQNRAAGWVTDRWPLQRMPQSETPTAHDGRFVLALGPKGKSLPPTTAFQVLLLPTFHPAMTITVGAWVRTAPEAGAPLVQDPKAALWIEGGSAPVVHSEQLLDQTNDWHPISATVQAEQGMQQIVLRINSDNQRAEFDDFSLNVDVGEAEWHDPVFQPVLINPSAESGSWGLRPELERRLPSSLVAVAEILPNPQPFDKVALWSGYANGQHKSFWGDFGWLSIPLPDALYTLLAVIIVIAAIGLLVRAFRRRGRWNWTDWLGLISLLALVATIAATYSWQMMGLATRSLTADLAGRYLFVLIVPIMWLILAGLSAIWALFRGDGAEDQGGETATRLPWGAWLYAIALTTFAAYCFLTLILPYYYA